MENRAVFLDRDGTINVDKGYAFRIEDLNLIPNAVEGLKMLQDAKYRLIIVTNQAGIGRGLYTEDDYFKFRRYLQGALLENGVIIDKEYFCSHHPNDNCNCRKPKTGMLEEAARDFNLNLKECWMIGDNLSDIQAGKNAGCKTVHVLTGVHEPIPSADFVAINMVEAAYYILGNKNK